MNYRSIGKKHQKISEIGLGSWQIGSDWGNVSEKEAFDIIETAIRNGITFFDTADVYGNGRSEELIGRYLAQHPSEIFVATKIGRTADLYPSGYSFKNVRNAIEKSLKRLNTDSLDLVQTHCIPTSEMQKGEIYEHLRKLKSEGKIKEFGASVESMDEALLLIQSQPELFSLQIIFNIFRQKPIETIFDIAKEKNIGIIARVPLASGLLTGKLTHSSHFSENDHRNYNRDGKFFNVGETFAGLPFHYGIEMVEELQTYLPEGLTLSQLALRWILDYDAVSVVIPGASKTQQVDGNAAISALAPLPQSLHIKLHDFYKDLVEKYIRGSY